MHAFQHILPRTKVAGSNYLQDFAAGMDPFGNWTADYGMAAQREGKSEGEHALKRTMSTAGGVLGGGLLVPAAVTGVTGAAQGFMKGKTLGSRLGNAASGLVSGAKYPFEMIGKSIHAGRGLKRVGRGDGMMTPEEMKSLATVAGEAPIKTITEPIARGVRDIRRNGANVHVDPQRAMETAKDVASGRYEDLIDPDIAKELAPRVNQALMSNLAGLGVGATVGGAGAFMQYGKGRNAERETSISSRLKRLLPSWEN